MSQINNTPLVSVLMTVYNREKYIAEAIESVINSSYKNWELIIVDDRSSDKSINIAQKYEQIDDRIRIFINEKNLGDYPNRNKAACYAKGKYIKYLDSDDIIYPDGLHTMVSAMEQYPEAVLGIHNLKEDGVIKLPYKVTPKKAYNKHFFQGGLLYSGPTGTIYKADFFNKVGGFKVEYGVASDVAYNLQCALETDIVIFQRDLVWWRPHEGQEINIRKNEYEKFYDNINSYYLLHKNCPLDKKQALRSYNNLKVIQVRKTLFYLKKLNFTTFFSRTKTFKLKTKYFFYSILPQKARYFFY